MNWTEGNLNRHSRAHKGKEILLRQKEHFAKARAGRLDANVKISPPLLSFLAIQAQSPVRHDALKSTSSRTHPSGGRLLSSRYFSEASVKLPKSAAFPEEQSEEEAMRQKRRRLLLRGDWVGTNMQKPIEMEFMKPRGSPSNPWSLKKSRRQASKQKLRRLLGVTHEGGRSKARGSAATVSPTSLRRMKIRVGSHERALGDSSNASPKSNGRQGELTGICGQPRYDNRTEYRQDRAKFSISGSDASHQSNSTASQTPLLTTSPLLFHPVPTRPALLQLIHSQSADSDNAASTLAQVGVDLPPVPPSQAEENDVWRTFVAAPDDSSALDEKGSSGHLEDATQRLISPGISQLGTSRHRDDTSKRAASVRLGTRYTNTVGEDKTPNMPTSLFVGILPSDPSDQRSSEALSTDDQITADADDDSTSRLESDLPQPSESPELIDNGASEEQPKMVSNSDEMSLLVVSSSTESSSSLEMVGEATPFQTDQSGDITTRMDAKFTQPAMLQDEGEDPASRDDLSAVVQKQLPNECTQDEDDMWRQFVFGDSLEDLDQVLNNARRDIVRSLRPSLLSTSTSSCDESQQDFATSSLGLGSTDRRDFADRPNPIDAEALTTVSASHVATAGASSPDASSETVSESLETAIRTDQATVGSSNSSSADDNYTSGLLFPNDSASSIRETGTGSLTINPRQLEKHGEPDGCFKFARPKLFLGKKIGHVDEQRQIALSAPQIRGTTVTYRQRRRTTDGRANIRKLPNYGSDPIEEFEGDSRSDRAEKGSLFGSLETEDGF
ncbi:hypothetical protein N8I77_001971 [Diaporthe amygdali]|uniref:Uncharacterized protein n=1 Tax=Phomopsis amygdali TaxID=1214568 RepID=A0AAD9SRM5_PHOAM|nr:hypothetical protein N8I77_001971 [Diaporthe amygdali]